MTFRQQKLVELLKTDISEDKYWEYISELRETPSEEVFDKAYAMAAIDNEKEQVIGIDILAQLGKNRPFKRQTMKLFFQILEECGNKKVLAAVLSAIGHNNEDLSDAQISFLYPFKNHTDEEVRYGLALALGGVEHPKAGEALITLTDDAVANIRNWAVFGLNLSDLDGEAVRKAFWERVRDEDEDTRLEAIVGLAQRKDIGIKAVISKELEQEDFPSLLITAIETLEDDTFLPRLKEVFAKFEGDNEINPDWLSSLKSCIEQLDS